jgi:phospholipid/cholesterol/gamma-HCH transport system substrate-binding protein
VNARTLKDLVKLIAFIIVTLFLTVVLASTIGSVGYGNVHTYKADFSDVTGLQSGDDVRIAGVKEGQVTGVKLVDRKYAQVSFGLDKKLTLHNSAQMQVRYRNLVGQRYLALTEGSGGDPVLAPGGTIPQSRTQPALDLSQLLNGFKPLFTALTPQDINSLSYEIIQTLQGEGGTIDTLLAHTASLTAAIADKDAVVGSVVTNLDQVLSTVASRDNQLSELVLQLQRLVSGLARDRNAIGNSLQGIDDLAQATVGLLRPARPLIKEDVNQLAQLSKTLSAHRSEIDAELKLLPLKLNTIIRTATYGSWFNFYLCGGDGTIILPNGTTINVAQVLKNVSPVCG